MPPRLLLDGLDEVPGEDRDDAPSALAQALSEWIDNGGLVELQGHNMQFVAAPRAVELAAALNRHRGLRSTGVKMQTEIELRVDPANSETASPQAPLPAGRDRRVSQRAVDPTTPFARPHRSLPRGGQVFPVSLLSAARLRTGGFQIVTRRCNKAPARSREVQLRFPRGASLRCAPFSIAQKVQTTLASQRDSTQNSHLLQCVVVRQLLQQLLTFSHDTTETVLDRRCLIHGLVVQSGGHSTLLIAQASRGLSADSSSEHQPTGAREYRRRHPRSKCTTPATLILVSHKRPPAHTSSHYHLSRPQHCHAFATAISVLQVPNASTSASGTNRRG